MRELCARYELDSVHDASALIAHVVALTGVPISIEPLPAGYPPQITGLINVHDHQAIIHLPNERGVYPAHVLFHEIAHLLMWDLKARAGDDSSVASLACSNEYVEYVAEALAQHLSARLLRIQTPRIERVLG